MSVKNKKEIQLVKINLRLLLDRKIEFLKAISPKSD